MADVPGLDHPFAGRLVSPVPPGRSADAAPEGLPELPLRYRSTRMVIVSFAADLVQLQQWLPPPVKARRSFGRFGFLNIQFVDMPETSIGPYRECVVSILCRDDFDWSSGAVADGWRPAPAFPLWLSVTTQIARDSGQAYWGYPKVVAETDFSLSGREFRGRVHAGGSIDIELGCRVPPPGDRVPVCVRSLTIVAGELHQTEIEGEARLAEAEPDGATELRLGGRSAISKMVAAARTGPPISVHHVSDFDYALPAASRAASRS